MKFIFFLLVTLCCQRLVGQEQKNSPWGKGGKNKFLEVRIIGRNSANEQDSIVQLTAQTRNFKKIIGYKWKLIKGKSRGNQSQEQFILNNLKSGQHQVQVTVSDNLGHDVESKIFVLNIYKSAVSSISGEPNKIIIQPAPKIFIDGPKIVKDIDSAISLIVHESIPEMNNSKTNLSPIVIINPHPVTIILPNNSTSISCTASDKDGRIVSYTWEKISGKECLMSGINNSSILLNNLLEGEYKFCITVQDNQGLTSFAFAELRVKSAPEVGLNNQQKIMHYTLKGGPANAFLNLLLPGLGHYYVSGNFKGEHKKPSTFLISLIYIGSAGGAVYYKLKSDDDYQQYIEMVNQRERQVDASGNLIGIRGLPESNAKPYYDRAQISNQNFLILFSTAGGILLADFAWTLIKGSNNKKSFNKHYILNKSLTYDYKVKQMKLGLSVSF